MAKYLSITDFAEFRGVTPSIDTTPSESQVLNYIDVVEKDFDSKVGDFSLQTGKSDIVKGLIFGFYIPYGHVSNISKVEVSNGDVFNTSWSDVPITDYKIDNSLTGRVLLKNPIINREYRVTFDSGYLIDDVPINIKYHIYLLVMNKIFHNHLFDNNVSDNVERIVDVEVYREITRGGNLLDGFSAMDEIIKQSYNGLFGGLKTLRY